MHRIEPNQSCEMTRRARRLRKEATIPERILWNLVRNRALGGHKFRRQQPIGPYVADFFCEAARLAIELDGRSHDGRAGLDATRDAFMQARGIAVLRIRNDDLLKHRESAAELILRAAGARINAFG